MAINDIVANVSKHPVTKHLARYATEYSGLGAIASYAAGFEPGLIGCAAITLSDFVYSAAIGAYRSFNKKARPKITGREIAKNVAKQIAIFPLTFAAALNLASVATSVDCMNTAYNEIRAAISDKKAQKNDEININVVCDQNFVAKNGEKWKEKVIEDSKPAFDKLKQYGINAKISEISQYHRDVKVNTKKGELILNEFNNEVLPQKDKLYVACLETNYFNALIQNIPGNTQIVETSPEIKTAPWLRAVKNAYGPFVKTKAAFKRPKPVLENKYAKLGIFKPRNNTK